MKTIKCESKFAPGDIAIKVDEYNGHKIFRKVVIQAVECKAYVDDCVVFDVSKFLKATKYVEVTKYICRYVRNDELEYISWPCFENALMTMHEFEKLMKEQHSTYKEYLNWVNSKDWRF